MEKPRLRSIGARPGTYALILESGGERSVSAGRLGELRLGIGCYVYIGSAFGPGGVKARCRHHLRSAANPHWHIDYLRAVTQLREIWFSHDHQRREHQWAALMAGARGARVPFPGFGATDCDCRTHLFFFDAVPSFNSFRRRIRQCLTPHDPVGRVDDLL